MKAGVKKLREAARALERARGEVVMPGWEATLKNEEEPVRTVAHAIAGDGVPPDECTHVDVRDVGRLIRYIADMMEA